MQKTEKFSLKLFEGTDKFDYKIINENFLAVEGAIKEATVSKTTSSAGVCSLGINLDSYVVLSAYCVEKGENPKTPLCIPYRSATTREWAVRIIDGATMSIVTNTDVEITYFFIRRK